MNGECYEHDIKWGGDSIECPVCAKEEKLLAQADYIIELGGKLAALEADRQRLEKETWTQYEQILAQEARMQAMQAVVDAGRVYADSGRSLDDFYKFCTTLDALKGHAR